MIDLTHTKREELIKFIRKQMLGPGGCNDNFSIASKDWSSEEEVLNTTPGSIYSTGILFPQKKSNEEDSTSQNKNIEQGAFENITQNDNDENDLTPSERNESNGSSRSDIDDEDIYSLNRRFPNTIGISCCLDKNVDLTKDIKIIISGRYYTKLKGKERTKVQVVVKINKEEFENFFRNNNQLHNFFSYKEGKISAYDFSKQLSDVRSIIKDINFKYAEKISKSYDSLKHIFNDIAERNRFLLSYRERLFTHLTRLKDGDYITNEEKSATIKMIKDIEKYECFISYLEDLVDMFDKKSFGFWQSHTFHNIIDLSSLTIPGSGNKVVLSPNKNQCLKDLIKVDIGHSRYLSLDLWLQKTINTKDKNDKDIYLKVLLQNTRLLSKKIRNTIFLLSQKALMNFLFLELE